MSPTIPRSYPGQSSSHDDGRQAVRRHVAASRSTRLLHLLAAWGASLASVMIVGDLAAAQPVQVGFLWHMHQPIYYPGENISQTQAAGHYSFSLYDVHNQRFGPYTTWPRDAIQAGQSLPHLGAQVSFSGSLMENLNRLEAAGVNGGMWNNWEAAYKQAAQTNTSLGNPRLDMVGFGYHHPLMPLLDERDMRMQIRLHKYAHEQTWGPTVPYSKGIFPAETAFAQRMIPALVAEGLEWAIVDNIHFDRATQGYPHTNASNLYPPNRADQINPDPSSSGGAWVQLNNLWAPSRVSAPFSYRPHHVQYIDPNTGQATAMVAVPAARYEGNEDGRGGFGALQYEQVMEQYRQYNTDPNHPLFVLLHHDGDNFGGGSESYYHSNWNNMVSWAATNPNYDVSTIQDYLDRFPVDPDDVIHVEPGSWAGADNGDPEFKKWLGDPGANGFSPDRNSWAVLTAAKNRVFTADDLSPVASIANVAHGTGSPTERAWHYLLQAEASDHWYWDGAEVWDSNVTRGANLAVAQANQVINAHVGQETTPPTVFLPQRESYNPGGLEWGATPEPSDFEVWTYAYDVSGLTNVTLKYRTDADGFNPISSTQNETYAGGHEVGDWMSVTMTATDIAPPPTILTPTYRAMRYGGMITGLTDVLVDYYVEAVDGLGNIARTDIQHVYIGAGGGSQPGSGVAVMPDPAQAGEPVTLTYNPAGGPLAGASQVFLHYGFNDWQTVPPDVPMAWNAEAAHWNATVNIPASASQFDAVFNNGAGVWDNNNGQDWHFSVEGANQPGFIMDGQLDGSAVQIAANGGQRLFAAIEGGVLYVATDDAGEGSDVFVYLAASPGVMQAANWAKAGQVAGWDAYLADENDNDFEAWFNASGTTAAATGPNGGVLEGTIDLLAEFGALPTHVYLAVGAYATADGGALVSARQTPASLNGDGNIDAAEYIQFSLVNAAADFNNDGVVDGGDLATWRTQFGAGPGADADGDGDSDGADFLEWQRGLNAQSAPAAAVPEPAGWLLLMTGLAALISGKTRRTALPLAAAVALGFLAPLEALAQSPPNPNFVRQQIFPSYQDFKNRITEISNIADSSQRLTELDALWSQLKAAGQTPYAQGDKVAFLYRGSASTVAFPGDFNGWSASSSSWRAAQVPNTDLWMLEKSFPADARLDYKIVLGGSNWILDPANTLQMWSGFGPNSELRMPDYQYPQQTVRQPEVPRGALTPNIRTTSANLGYDVNYRVYTPPGYSAGTMQNLPVVYVTDGHEYSADHMGSMVVVLDNLIAAGDIQPTMAVFIDPRDPNNLGNNRRASQYVQNPQFAAFVADELVAAIDSSYPTLAAATGRTILGTSLGGINSAYFGATRPDAFENIAIQSPSTFSSSLTNLYNAQLAEKLDVFLTAGTIGDGGMGPTFASLLNTRGFDYQFIQVNEGHSWGNWRALLDDILVGLVGPTPALAGDFNDDGVVDHADLTLWQAGHGKATGAVRADGDANSDRRVDAADFLAWQQQLGSTTSASAAGRLVPEPNAAAIAACLAAGAFVRRLIGLP